MMPTPQTLLNMSGKRHTRRAAGAPARPVEQQLCKFCKPQLASHWTARFKGVISSRHDQIQRRPTCACPATAVSPPWANSLLATASGSPVSVTHCPLERSPSNQFRLQAHKWSDSLSSGQEDISSRDGCGITRQSGHRISLVRPGTSTDSPGNYFHKR